MAVALPINIDTTTIERQHAESLGSFRQRMEKIQARKPSVGTDALARELGSDCKVFLDRLEEQRKLQKEPILEAGRRVDEFFKNMAKPAQEARQIANAAIAAWDQEQRRIAEEERREAERLAREQAEAEAKARAEALAAEAALVAESNPQEAESLLEQAAQVEAEPIIPVVAPVAPPPKTEGASVRYKLKGTVRDPYALMQWMLSHRGVISVKFSESDIDRALARGLELPGIDVTKTPIVSNRAR
jgi:hypothetical protein